MTIYSRKVAEGLGAIGRALGVPRGDSFRFGVRNYPVDCASLRHSIFISKYEWSAHAQPAGLRAGLEQSVIDVVKYDRPAAGLAEKTRC